MILEVLARPPGSAWPTGDAVGREQRGIADTGDLEQMRRVDRAGGEDDLAVRRGTVFT